MSLGLGERINGSRLADPVTAAPYVPYEQIGAAAVLADFSKRLADLEKAVKISVPNDRIVSMIALTSDTALIASDKIAMVGETTFFDWHRDVTGQATGVIDPSITQIRGGVIKTGSVQNLTATAYVNLDATTTGQTFIACQSAISIMADGQFTFGSSSGKKLIWDGVDLTLGNSSLLGSTSVSTVVSNAASGATAYSSLGSKLNNSASDILSGNVQVQTSGGLRVGTIAWDGSGNLTSGSGIALTAKGIVGASSGVATFSIDGTTGAAVFKGDITGASGTFAGNINTSGQLIATGSNSGGGYYGSVVGNTSIASTSGVVGVSTTSYGVVATSSATGVAALAAVHSGSGNAAYMSANSNSVQVCTSSYALSCVGDISTNTNISGNLLTGSQVTATIGTGYAPLIVPNTTNMVTNLNAQYLGGQTWASYHRVTSGSSYQVGNFDSAVLLDAALGTFTLTMPASPSDGMEVSISTWYNQTALTHAAYSGHTIQGALSATVAVGTGGRWKFMAATNSWWRLDKGV